MVREIGPKEGFEQLAVVRDFQVQEFVDNDVLAEGPLYYGSASVVLR